MDSLDSTLYDSASASVEPTPEQPLDSGPPEEEIIWEEASTFEELISIVEDNTAEKKDRYIHVTDDLVVPAGMEYFIDPRGAALIVDLDAHTLFVEGSLSLYRGVQLCGLGGENGLLHVRTKGTAYIYSAALIAKKDGYAIWQEEGSILKFKPSDNSVGEVHYATKPVASPFSYISPLVSVPVAVVHDGQTLEDVLPATDSVVLYWRGVADMGTQDEEKFIPVEWDLELYREQLEARQRVLITGSYPEAVAFQAPVCLVVFQNTRPATFLDCYGMEFYGWPAANVRVELADPRMGCRFEWSQDKVTWFPADSKQVPHWKGLLSFNLTFSQDEPPAYPYYLSAVVDYPDGSKGYSDVIVINEPLTLCDNGGNRDGGTNIIDPPFVPDPDPPAPPDDTNNGSIAQRPASSNNSGNGINGKLKPKLKAAPVTPENTGRGEIAVPPVTQNAPPPAPGVPNSSAPETTAIPEALNPPEKLNPPDKQPSSPGPEKDMEVLALSEPKYAPKRPGAVPIAAGCTAIAATVSAAGFYLNPNAFKRLIESLKQFFKK